MSYAAAQHVLSGLLLGHSLFAASYIGLSLFFHIRSKRQAAVTRYQAISAQLDTIASEAKELNQEMLGYAHCMALVAAAVIITANCPDAAAQPALDGFTPAGLLPASTEWPSSQIKGAELSWTEDDGLEVSLESIAAFEATVATATETAEYLAEPTERYTDWTVKRLRKAVEADYGPMRGYYKKARLIAIMEGDLDQF